MILWCGSWSLHLTKFHSNDQIETNKIGEAYSTYEEEERCLQSFRREPWGKEPTWNT